MNYLRGLYIDGVPIWANDWKLQLKSRTHQTDVLFSFRFNYYFSGFFLSFSIFGFWEIENIMAPICFFGDLNADRKCSFKHKACCFRIISKRGCWKWPFSDSESRWEKVGRLNGKLDADRDSKERERANMQRLPPLSTCSPNSIFSPNSFPFSGGSRAESAFPFSFPAQISTAHHFLVLSTPLTRSENLDWKTFVIFLPLTSYPIYSGILF